MTENQSKAKNKVTWHEKTKRAKEKLKTLPVCKTPSEMYNQCKAHHENVHSCNFSPNSPIFHKILPLGTNSPPCWQANIKATTTIPPWKMHAMRDSPNKVHAPNRYFKYFRALGINKHVMKIAWTTQLAKVGAWFYNTSIWSKAFLAIFQVI